MIGTWRCIATTGTSTIRSMIRSERRSWGVIWTTSDFLPRPVVRGRGQSAPRCAYERSLVGSIAQLQRPRPRLAERTQSSLASCRWDATTEDHHHHSCEHQSISCQTCCHRVCRRYNVLRLITRIHVVPSCGWRLPPSDRHRMLRHFARSHQSSCEMPTRSARSS